MKIITVVGARPQFIKASAISRAIANFNKRNPSKRIREVMVHTGQHYDYMMDRAFFEELELPEPDYNLGVGSASHGKQTGMMLERIEPVLKKERPDLVIVYGDTNSTLAGALASAKLNLPLAHVEAGLRSYNRLMPEEINRVITDHISDYLFCPTVKAVKNLLKEGLRDEDGRIVKNVGDVMYDSIIYYSDLAEKRSTILKELGLITSHTSSITLPYYLVTLHRAENTDDRERLRSILEALYEIGKEVCVVLPLHPRTRKMIKVYGFDKYIKGIRIIDPISYLDMLLLERNSKVILTDSGGIQKEAYWFGVPCLTLRDETEWVETLRGGSNILVGSGKERILEEVRGLNIKRRNRGSRIVFGDGRASERIIEIIVKTFKG